MFKKTERLTRKEFDTFFKTGKRFHFAPLTIIYAPYPTLHASVVVGKKVSKLAVRRNTIRRRIYARLRLAVKVQGATGVFIVITKPAYNSLTKAAADDILTASIAQVLKST